ncbi:MAG TPA: ABC transporter substrate-binding protein [Candidatus Binatia bacterium]|nr:ABC transporter substrate-binding protein [Candidatus Binatia bacterium]
MTKLIRRVLQLPLLFVAACIAVGFDGRNVADAASAPVRIKASYGGELGYQAPLWVAHDLKLFAKHGIESELIRIAGGSRSIATLMSNSIQIAQSAGVSTVQADLVGGDVVIVATSTNRATVSIVAQPKTIKKPQDLAGKSVGLVGRGDMNEYFFLNALDRWGIDPKSITFLSIPGSQPRLVAVANGNLDATILAPPFTFEAEKLRLTTLADFSTSSDPFPQSGLVVRKDYLRSNRDTVKKIIMAYVEAIHVLKNDAEKSTAIMKKYMRITDDAIAKRSFEYYSKLFSQPPLTEEKGVATVLKFLATQSEFANAKNAKASDFFDNSVIAELQREGYLARFK